MTQEQALEIMKRPGNVFLTGQPGTGKTWLVNKYIDWCVDNGQLPTVTASTGPAAVHVRGRTLHSWAGIRDENDLSDQDIRDIIDGYAGKRIRETEILIIDEVSMISGKLLNIISKVAMVACHNNLPFGGIKVIAVGDFFQLPPVKGVFAFESQTWKDLDFRICYLHEQKRQSDAPFIDLLTGIRQGFLTEAQKNLVRARVTPDVSSMDIVRLDTHNAKVDKINQMKLERLTTPPRTYVMSSSGNEQAVEGLKKHCLSPERLILKEGALVMFTKNDRDLRWVNGTQGKVVKMEPGVLMVELLNGATVVGVTPDTWEAAEGYGRNKKVFASITQMPLRLAWAITIHKSQGMTLDRAVIDVTNVFSEGHAYVAISRIRSLDGLYLQGFLTENFLKTSDKVREADKIFLAVGN